MGRDKEDREQEKRRDEGGIGGIRERDKEDREQV